MNLKELFELNFLKISALKYLNIQNKSIMNNLNLEGFKRQTFASYIFRNKDKMIEIQNLNISFFDSLKEDYRKHRNIEIILNKIDLEFSIDAPDQKIETKKLNDSLTRKSSNNSKPSFTEKEEEEENKVITPLSRDELVEAMKPKNILSELRNKKRNLN